MPRKTKKSQTRPTDNNLALISIIMGASSFMFTFFTGIPAIVLGIMALKQKSSDRLQAKLGIVFGIVGSLIIIPIVAIGIMLLKAPLNEQFSVTQAEKAEMESITDALNVYKSKYDSYPACSEDVLETDCASWQRFITDNAGLVKRSVAFEESSAAIEDRPAGTIVYATRTTCFINTPTEPEYLNDNEYVKVNSDNYSAIVYFHEQGRACFPTNTD